jgi:hypothetical protein
MTDRPTIESLTQAWKDAKWEETKAAAKRIAIESDIYELVRDQLPGKGTFTAETGMKIATGYAEKWDQESLNKAYQRWPSSVPFPFKGEWKPDGKAVAYVRDNLPEEYSLLRDALTLTPKKPTFSVKE